MTYQKVTFIDDLPELDQVNEDEDEVVDDRVKRFVRNNQNIKNIDERSGMSHRVKPYTPKTKTIQIPQAPEVVYEPPVKDCNVNCQEVFIHASDCPICRKFYKQDNTMYLVIIAILILMCALLFKKVLNV